MTQCVLALIDIDQPESAKSLLREMNSLFSEAEAHAAHVIPFGFYSYVEPYVSEQNRSDMIASVKASMDQILAEAGAANATPHALYGGVGEQSLLLATKIGADVIILNAARPDSAHTTLGTHAAQIARNAPCSVYLTRQRP